jgi:hypothetical protein
MLVVTGMMALSNSSALTQEDISYLGYRELEAGQNQRL